MEFGRTFAPCILPGHCRVQIPYTVIVKIDTKERFEVIRPQDACLSANMSGDLSVLIDQRRTSGSGNLILDLSLVSTIDPAIGSLIAQEQQKSYEMQRSFVICCLQGNVESALDELGILELLNQTPTESEAWDIVQMEEIERELLG
jgi:anti-anti-sigma regulatory factor